ncbi:hypothetical protein B0H14DRAFT_3171451 [Mycena olivaceomarginata]|nr:hypothetical protein B0H14DRAFT_3171451 [Mycena olivaceomarginata]
MAAKSWYHAVVAGFRKLRDIGDHGDDKVESLESLMSFEMGSAPNGGTVSHLMCGNSTNARSCPERGLNICPNCRLIKYCSEKCKNQHWAKHRSSCTHPYLSDTWQPSWVTEGRDPAFLYPSNLVTLFRPTVDFWGDLPAMDCLQLPSNEGDDPYSLPDLKLCFAGDVWRSSQFNPNGQQSALGLRRVLRYFAERHQSGPDKPQSRYPVCFIELRPIYRALPEAGADYVKRCINFIYASRGEFEADLSFRRCLDTRGEGKVYSVQPSAGIKRPLEMFHSNYSLSAALHSMKDTTLDPDRLDVREKYFAGLKPAHRMAFQRFRETGGVWMVPEDANALFGWDAGVQNSGIKHGTSPEDILGCLFFHVKDELREVRAAGQRSSASIYTSPRSSPGCSRRASPSARCRRSRTPRTSIGSVTANLVDFVGMRACLADWGPLLNRENEFASILMQTKAWHTHQPHATAQWGPHAMKVLEDKCNKVPGLIARTLRIFESLDAFHDNDRAFQEYLSDQDTEQSAAAFDLQLRSCPSSPSQGDTQRFGIPLNAPRWQKLPDLSSNEFYDLSAVTIGGANLPDAQCYDGRDVVGIHVVNCAPVIQKRKVLFLIPRTITPRRVFVGTLSVEKIGGRGRGRPFDTNLHAIAPNDPRMTGNPSAFKKYGVVENG